MVIPRYGDTSTSRETSHFFKVARYQATLESWGYPDMGDTQISDTQIRDTQIW
jgi:hypothetical protein